MIDVTGLHFTYPNKKTPTLRGLSFSVKEGEIFGFLGPSGAGKSTTLNILTGLLKDYEGTARVLGKEVKEAENDYYERIGVSFELPCHYQKMTALENLNFFGSLYKSPTTKPEKLLEKVNLLEDKDKKVADFSKGMKMRLNLARALLHDPDILFLDEPTTGLDPVNARRVKDIILELKQKGKTIVISTHNMSVVEELCDNAAFIVAGEISLIDSPRELKIRYGKRQVAVSCRIDGKKQLKEFPLESIGQNQEFLTLLREAEIETIHTREATLEDIFIKVTGRDLQ